MGDPLETKTITLSCGKLTTGVTIRPWTGIFMLRNLSSPETYFQAAFRVQSPWEVTRDDGKSLTYTGIDKHTGENGVIKRFQYPGAFEQGFLSLNK